VGIIVERRKGDIFKSGAELLIAPVDSAGGLSSNLGSQFVDRFPKTIELFRHLCRIDILDLYTTLTLPVLTDDLSAFTASSDKESCDPPRWVTFFATRDANDRRYHLTDISLTMIYFLRYELPVIKPFTIAIPALGCGSGGLGWGDVEHVITRDLQSYDIDHEIVAYLYYPLREELAGRATSEAA
jgi:hypothetical protein